MDEVKVEDGEEGEMDEQGLAISVRRVRNFAYFTVYLSEEGGVKRAVGIT